MKIQNIETGEEFEINGSVNVIHVVDEVEEIWVHYSYINNNNETMTIENIHSSDFVIVSQNSEQSAQANKNINS